MRGGHFAAPSYIFVYFNHIPVMVGTTPDGGGAGIVHYATQITFADEAACALDDGGVPHCWGFTNEGLLGNDDGGFPAHFVPQTIAGLTISFKGINGHATNLCGIDNANQVWCWGLTDLGQIGNGSTSGSSGNVACQAPCQITPKLIPSFNASVISSSANTFAIGVDGGLFGWGRNDYGALGHAPASGGDETCFLPDASVACAPSPVRVVF